MEIRMRRLDSFAVIRSAVSGSANLNSSESDDTDDQMSKTVKLCIRAAMKTLSLDRENDNADGIEDNHHFLPFCVTFAKKK